MTRSALKRQISHIAGQLQAEDIASIRSIVSGESQQAPDDVTVVTDWERFGDELISGNHQALGLLVERHAGLDVQHLRQLVRNAKKERERNQPAKSTRQLFDYLESLDGELD